MSKKSRTKEDRRFVQYMKIGYVCPVSFSQFYDCFIGQHKSIKLVARQLEVLRNRSESSDGYADDHDIIFDNVVAFLSRWRGIMFLGVRKPDDFQNAANLLFSALIEYLKATMQSGNDILRNCANKVLYQGVVYRYLGYPIGSKDSGGYISPKYNDNYVSWSKIERIPYIEGKLKPNMTHLTAEISGGLYGIDLSAFGIGNGVEEEVIFPTIRNCVIKVQNL